MLCKYDSVIKDQQEKGIIERVDKKSKEGEKKLHSTPCATHTSKGYYQSSHCVRCFCKNEENKLKPE